MKQQFSQLRLPQNIVMEVAASVNMINFYPLVAGTASNFTAQGNPIMEQNKLYQY